MQFVEPEDLNSILALTPWRTDEIADTPATAAALPETHRCNRAYATSCASLESGAWAAILLDITVAMVSSRWPRPRLQDCSAL